VKFIAIFYLQNCHFMKYSGNFSAISNQQSAILVGPLQALTRSFASRAVALDLAIAWLAQSLSAISQLFKF